MQEPSTHNESQGRTEETLDGSTPPAVLDYAERLLRHIEKMDAARAEVQAATRAYREKPSDRRRRRAEASLVAHARAEARLRRSAWRLRTAIGGEEPS